MMSNSDHIWADSFFLQISDLAFGASEFQSLFLQCRLKTVENA